MGRYELYKAARCPYRQEIRDRLEFTRREFEEYGVESNAAARQRIRELDSNVRKVPVLVEDGRIVQVGWQGHGCPIE